MFGKNPHIDSLQLRKELLIAESEINRVQLLEKWQATTDGVKNLTDRIKTVSSLSSAAAVLVSGVLAFRRSKPEPAEVKPSWFQSALKGAQIAGDIWQAYRARQR